MTVIIRSTINQSEKGAANGVATLDATAKLPVSQLPTSAMEYKGVWDASTNTPTLASGTGTNGDYYLVSADGTTTLDGITDWEIGDAVLFNGSLSIWQKVGKAGGGGDSIYTANGTIGSGRIATLTDTLTYKGIGTSLGQRNLIITDINNDYILENYDNGYFKRTIRSGNNLGVIQNGAGTQGLWIQTSSELAGAGGLLIKNSKADTNYLKYFTDNFKAPDAQWYSNGAIHHRIRSNGTSSTVLSQVSFFTQGFFGFGFNVGASAPISTEDISLQGETVIKGDDTLSTSTALAIYDGDATPNKLWDFRNNGDVVLGQESTIDLDDNKLTFDVGTVASGTNPNIGLRVDGSNVYYGGGLNSSPLLQVDSDLGNVLNVNSGGYFIATSDYSTAIALFQKRGTNLGLSLASNKQAMGVPLIQHKPLLTSGSSQMIQQFVSSTLVDFQMINADGATGDNPNVKHWLRFGDSLSQASFFRTGFSGRGFIVGAQLVLGTEDISLQGETLIDGTLDMNSNRITNAVVNPSVQETASTASFTINADEQTDGVLTAMAAATTIAAPTGSPVQSQNLIFRFKDNGTARALTWNAIFRAIGVTLPTTTTANKTLYVGCKYNSTDTKWDVIAVKEEA